MEEVKEKVCCDAIVGAYLNPSSSGATLLKATTSPRLRDDSGTAATRSSGQKKRKRVLEQTVASLLLLVARLKRCLRLIARPASPIDWLHGAQKRQ